MAEKVLVVFYSRSGTTRTIAESLSEILACDIEDITETKSRAGLLGYARSLQEAFEKRPSRGAQWKRDPSTYDLIVIGTPVWAWSIASPIRAYLMANRGSLRQVAFFCTQGATGSESVFTQMQGLAGKRPRAVCAFTAREVNSGSYRPNLSAFAAALEPASSAPRHEDRPRRDGNPRA